MATWRNAVIVGRPYNVFEDGKPREEAIRLGEHFAATHGVSAWARDDLSAWFPGGTGLVLAGRGLRAEDAERFGFTHLAGDP